MKPFFPTEFRLRHKLLRLVGEVARNDGGGLTPTKTYFMCVSVGMKPLRPVGPVPLQGGAVASRGFWHTLGQKHTSSSVSAGVNLLSPYRTTAPCKVRALFKHHLGILSSYGRFRNFFPSRI